MSAETSITSITIRQASFDSVEAAPLISALDDEVELLYPDWRDFAFEGEGTWLNESPEEMGAAATRGDLAFFVAFAVPVEGGSNKQKAVGCVGVRVLRWFPLHREPQTAEQKRLCDEEGDGTRTAEIKRMFVLPEYRGQRTVRTGGDGVETAVSSTSIAAVLVRHAETHARDRMGVRRLVLETGCRQGAALKLYDRLGFTKRKDFGDYMGAGVDVGGLSYCAEKWLA